MNKPEKKKLIEITCFPDIRANEINLGVKCYNQGLSAMETYYKGSELSEGEIESLLDKIEITKDGDGYHKLREYWLRFNGKEIGGEECNALRILAKAIIAARDEKKGEE